MEEKDPSPNNDENEIFDEYFRRIAFANENFSNYIEGWRSDRGMVYTILGAPNNIDRHPFEYDSKPYEVWEYYDLNRSFVFLDQTGFGDYRLVTPLTGDLYRYQILNFIFLNYDSNNYAQSSFRKKIYLRTN